MEKEEEVPYLCAICKEPFLKFFVSRTRCNHFFCESCAQKHHKKTDRCFVCEEPTLGVFERGILEYNTDPQNSKAKVKVAADNIREFLKTVNGKKLQMMNEGVLAAKAVKIMEKVETLLKKSLEKEMEAFETGKDAFKFVEEAVAAVKTMLVKMHKANHIMVKLYSERSKKRFVEEVIAKMVKLESERLNNRKKRFGGSVTRRNRKF